MNNDTHFEAELPRNVSEREALESVMEPLAPYFAKSSGRAGLFVATRDAGSRTSVQFWRDAMRVGVAFANPELFPWCLANAPCAAIARRFKITGPNVTWLGDDALASALAAAHAAIDQHSIDAAFVVEIVFGSENGPGHLCLWRLGCSRSLDHEFSQDTSVGA